jgi:para-nitrobenzyl esterase
MVDPVIVETTGGKLRGLSVGTIKVFKGIPYGAPPVGARRFMPPVAGAPWAGVRDAFDYGPRAMQVDNALGLPPDVLALFALSGPQRTDENCLVLNVWTPAVGDGGRRPVMFWCHGGAFITGSGSAPWTDGANLARAGDVVVVTINHRLGAFGFLHLEDIAGKEFAASGSAGMLDIVAALEWVRDNIAAFGGDPGNVTIFGESGGGAKVSVLMAMPAAKNLFHRAIIQSGPAVEMASRADGNETASKMLAAAGFDAGRAGELRRMPAEQLLKLQTTVLSEIRAKATFVERRRKGFNPVIDGKHLPAGPFEPTAPAISADVPLIIGSNKDEMTLFLGHAPWVAGLQESGIANVVRGFAGERAEALVAAYRRARPNDKPQEIAFAIATDQGIRLPSLVMAERKLALKAAPIFVYLFAQETPVLDGRLKSPHTLEIPYVFDTTDVSPLTGDAPNRRELAHIMSQTWIAFARTGDPNHGGIPAWPSYTAVERLTMIFDQRCRIENDPYGAERRAWADQGTPS